MLCLLAGPVLASCADQAADSVDYAVDGALVSYNTNTVAGAASGGPQAFARALTGFTYHGPEGQIVGDTTSGPPIWSPATRWCSTTRSNRKRCTPTGNR